MNDKLKLFAWACSVVREHVDSGTYGTLTISMAEGKISGIKQETNRKPIIDDNRKG